MSQKEQDTRQSQLSDIRNLSAQANNGKICIGYQTLDIDNTAVYRLTIPANTTLAEITLEVNTSSTNTNVAARYTADGTTPITGAASASTHGIPIGDFDTIVLSNINNINNFRVIAVDAVTHKFLRIIYFK